MDKLLDYKNLLKDVDLDKISVVLKKSDDKGVGLYATKPFLKGETIAYYKLKIFKESKYESPTDSMYSFEIYRKNGKPYKSIIGDIDLGSFPDPIGGITYWAPFANEPNLKERINAEIDENQKENYRNKNYSKAGEYIIYILRATKKIKKGEEILWYYGKDYTRDYKIGKKR